MYGVAEAFFAHWSAAHAVANAVAIGTLALLVARREGFGVLARIALIAFAAQVLALACLSGALEYRGASGFAYALAAYMLVRSARKDPWQSAAIAIAGLGYVIAAGTGAIVSPWLPQDVRPDIAVHLAGAVAGCLAATPPAQAIPVRAARCNPR